MYLPFRQFFWLIGKICPQCGVTSVELKLNASKLPLFTLFLIVSKLILLLSSPAFFSSSFMILFYVPSGTCLYWLFSLLVVQNNTSSYCLLSHVFFCSLCCHCWALLSTTHITLSDVYNTSIIATSIRLSFDLLFFNFSSP